MVEQFRKLKKIISEIYECNCNAVEKGKKYLEAILILRELKGGFVKREYERQNGNMSENFKIFDTNNRQWVTKNIDSYIKIDWVVGGNNSGICWVESKPGYILVRPNIDGEHKEPQKPRAGEKR